MKYAVYKIRILLNFYRYLLIELLRLYKNELCIVMN